MEKKLSFLLALFLVMVCGYFAHQKIQENILAHKQSVAAPVKPFSMAGKWGDSSANGEVYLYLFILESDNKIKGWYVAKDPTSGSSEEYAAIVEGTPGFVGTVAGKFASVNFTDPRFANQPASLELNGDSLTWTILHYTGKEPKQRLPQSFILSRGAELETDYWAHHVKVTPKQ